MAFKIRMDHQKWSLLNLCVSFLVHEKMSNDDFILYLEFTGLGMRQNNKTYYKKTQT